MINIKTQWGISETKTALENTCTFFKHFRDLNSQARLRLPAGNYTFNMIFFLGQNDIQFHGDTNASGEPTTTIKFQAPNIGDGQKKECRDNSTIIKEWNNSHCYLEIKDADNFNIHDLAFDGVDGGEREGGVWVKDGATNGMLKNLKVHDAAGVSLVVGGGSKSNPAHDIEVEDCTVYGQRRWDKGNKAMIIASGYGYNITFRDCKTFSLSQNNNDYYSPADHFGTDNATNVEFHRCVANGIGVVENYKNDRKGAGFWNEAGGTNTPDHEASAIFYSCTATETGGGLAGTQNADVEAHNFMFKNCSYYGWAAWARCCGNFELYDSVFDGCASIGGSGIKRGGFAIEGAPDGKVIKFKRNEFKNTPQKSDEPEYDNINLFSEEQHTGDIEIIDNTFDDNVTANPASDAENTVYIYENTFNGSNANLNKNEGSTNYNWVENKKQSATATAINSPTASTTVSVFYENNVVQVQYNNGESLDSMLIKMRDAVNTAPNALITAAVNTYDNSITFTQKAGASEDVVSFVHEFSDWGNGLPFNPMSPMMS